MVRKFDFLVIGSGIAGMSFALKVAHKGKVALICKSGLEEANTYFAQGGVASVTNLLVDNFDKHIEDTMIAGDWISDREAVEKVVREAPAQIEELIKWGVDFDKNEKGEFDLHREGGHSEFRILHHKDNTGAEIQDSLIKAVQRHPNIEVMHGEVTEIPAEGVTVIASGPLTSDTLAEQITNLCGGALSFFDAAAPIVTRESLDMEHCFTASRYDKGTPDYINCPMTKEEYQAFWAELVKAEEAEVHGFEDSGVFEGCMPVEVMARRGEDTLRFGPLKPRGLVDPKTGREPYAVVQLRRDNADGTIYNLVGFQTHLKWGEQKRVFSMIPALHDAQYLRYGVMHRNTYLDSPRLLDRYYRLKSDPRIAFAGQMTGVEGYVESCASGFLAGIELARRLKGQAPLDLPRETAIGALGLYVSNESVGQFQPMNINFGIMPPLDHRVKGKRNKNAQLSQRSLAIIEQLKQEVLSYEDHH